MRGRYAERMTALDRLVLGNYPQRTLLCGEGKLNAPTTGCDFFTTPTNCTDCTTTGDYLYVANGNNTNIAGFGVSTAGALSVLPSSPYNNGVAAQSLAITPTNTFLYAATTSGIFCYLINSDGSITIQNSGSAVAADVVATSMQ